MIKQLNENNLSYNPSNLVFKDQETAKVKGSISVLKANSNILLKLSDETGKTTINQLVFPNSNLYNFFEPHINEKLPCVADIKYVTNVVGDKSYQAMEIHNIHCEVLTEEEKKAIAEKAEEEKKTSSAQLKAAIKSIKDPLLYQLCINIYNDRKMLEKVMNNPATEHSAYNEKYGIINMIADTVNLTVSTVSALNSNFRETSPQFNLDLMKAGAILCNIGRAYMLEFDEGGNIVKTEEGIVDNETLITRDIIMNTLNHMATLTDENGNLLYNTNVDTVKELIHMICSSKSKIEYNPSMTPRTKHAMLLADIVSMVFTKGLFENLEKNHNGEKFVKAYEAGKNYVLY